MCRSLACLRERYCSTATSVSPTTACSHRAGLTGAVYRISPNRKRMTVIAQFVSFFENPNNPDGPADINVDLSQNRLLVPLFDANELAIMQLE